MKIDGEIKNLIIVWTLVAATMCYCHTIGKLISQGTSRLIAIFPAILLLLFLPLRLTSAYLGGPSYFFIGWLSTFKLLLFSFGKGPLFSNPPLPLLRFIPLACLPIKFQHQPIKTQNRNHKSQPPLYQVVITAIILAFFITLYTKTEFFHPKNSFHPKFLLFLYSLHMYIALEFSFALASTFTRKLLSVQLEPQFDKPYLCTSLQDFWGKRWNLSVNRLLYLTVYEPVVIASSYLIGRKWAPLPGILATFIVSAIMHELIFYYFRREDWEPSWDSMCFFVVHGVFLAVEVGLKKVLRGKLQLPRFVSCPLTVVFVLFTALWLFVPALVRCRVYEKSTTGFIAGCVPCGKACLLLAHENWMTLVLRLAMLIH